MRWRGILIGGGLGWLIGGPFGAVLGALMGGAIDGGTEGGDPKQRRFPPGGRPRSESFSNTDRSFLFVLHLVGIMTIVARADGRLDNREVRALFSFFQDLGFRGEDLETIRRLMKEAVGADLNLLAICDEYGRISSYEERLLLVRALYAVATADGQVHHTEFSVISRVVSYMGIGEHDHRSIRHEFGAGESAGAGDSAGSGESAGAGQRFREREGAARSADYFATLGVTAKASNEEVKKAYREMARKYHPDKVNHLGEEFVKLANGKFRAIHEAYTAIRKQRKF